MMNDALPGDEYWLTTRNGECGQRLPPPLTAAANGQVTNDFMSDFR